MRLTVQCGIVKLTRFKKTILDREYNNLQAFLRGDKTVPLYSANKQQALRYYKKIDPKREYPISLRNDLINLRRSKTFWFLKIPVYGVRGGIKVPIKPHREIPENGIFRESKIIRKNGKYIAMLTFEIPTPPLRKTTSILAIDLGERYLATAVLLSDSGNVEKVRFFGKKVRGIRRHFAWLRKRLGERKLLKDVKRIGRKEHRLVNDQLHKISKEVVSLADSTNSCIVLGSLTGIRENTKGRGKRLNRIVANMPFYTLSQYIEYKAREKGIPVIYVNEHYSSRTCHICNNRGKRKTQGLFVCPVCGEYNADANGAANLGKRLLGYMLLSGAVSEPALNGGVPFQGLTSEAYP